MADRYWVGGTAAWDGTVGTKWSATDGGTGGASLPIISDDVYFTALSGPVTVSVSGGSPACRNLNFTGFTGTLGGSVRINLAGNCTLVSSMGFTHTGPLSWQASTGGTFISAGKTVQQIELGTGSAGPTLNLGDALTLSSNISMSGGTFTTNNYSVTATYIQLLSNNAKTLNLGSSQVTLTSDSGFAYTSGVVTLNAGTSHIILTNGIAGFSGGNLAFYNVSFTATTAGNYNISGANTFNNLSIAAPASVGVRQVTFDSSTTINGILSTTGTAGNRRVWFGSTNYSLARTLTINSAPSLTDADFRDIYVIGTAAPISGTRIGNFGGCQGITFSTPKTVYWNNAAQSNWNTTSWALISGGTPNDNNYPLAQDTAIVDNNSNIGSNIIQVPSTVSYLPNVDLSARTSSFQFNIAVAMLIYGDLRLSSSVSVLGTSTLTFAGRKTQILASAGRTFACTIVIDSYGGSVELEGALSLSGTRDINVNNGTFDTKGYAVTAYSLISSSGFVRTVNLGSSVLNLSSPTFINFSTSGMVFNPGTSQINGTSSGTISFYGGGATFWNVAFTGTNSSTNLVNGTCTFNNLTFTPTTSNQLLNVSLESNLTINGTLTCAGATAVRRIFVRSSVLGTTRTLTVNSLSAQDCDFRDITIAGAAAGSSPTRAGDCGGNTGITFPAAKTVYWNLAGTQDWSATGWAPSSGGTPNINQFPLAQDTAVFDNTGAITLINTGVTFNFGTIDFSNRTSAVSFSFNSAGTVYGNFKLGTGVTVANNTTIAITFAGRGTQTITSNGVSILNGVTVNSLIGTVQLADALTINQISAIIVTTGTFDAGIYNVTTGNFLANGGALPFTLKMGSGTWTLSGTGGWNASPSGLVIYKGTANIILSDTGTIGRIFNGGGYSYNKLTIGGTTGTSTTTISGNNQFTELASTKTVAHTIALGSTTQTFGKWSVTGTAGNVVTVTGTGTSHNISGERVSGVDYLAMGTIGFSNTSPGEFYAGANSTGTNANIIKTAAPAPTTRYWRGGTGTWDATTTTNWSNTSGGVGGASVPTSADAVVFNSASNPTAYTVTCTATQLRCGSLTFAPPASGNVTWSGTAALAIHGNLTLPASGLTRLWNGQIILSGSTTGRTFTTNGVALSSGITVDGVGCEWTLGSALSTAGSVGSLRVNNGAIRLQTFNLTADSIQSDVVTNSRTISLGTSTVTLATALITTAIDLGTTENSRANLTFNAGSSQINCIGTTLAAIRGNNQTFHNVSLTANNSSTFTLSGANTFNNFLVTGLSSSTVKQFIITANQTINGTLTLSNGTNATMRTFVRSDTIGTTRTLTCAAFSGTDADFRDITIAGVAAPVSGTRLGDCKGNSGITFGAGVNKYWRAATSANWASGSINWSLTDGGTGDVNYFPLSQDTCVFATYPNSAASSTINAAYNIGTIDMSARTSNTMTLATGVSPNIPSIYGNWINGTGTTLTGTGEITFAGRNSQTITSAGRTFTQGITINTPSGSVSLQDAFVSNRASTLAINLTDGAFNAVTYNVTLSNAASGVNLVTGGTKILGIGSGTWVVAGSNISWSISGGTITGTGTISLTSASAKTFNGGDISYSGITLNQGGAGLLTITGNNTFANINNTYKDTGATSITFGATIQTLQQFTATGTIGKQLTLNGTSAASPANLILTGSSDTTSEYLTVNNIRMYKAGTGNWKLKDSINGGSFGAVFTSVVTAVYQALGNFFAFF